MTEKGIKQPLDIETAKAIAAALEAILRHYKNTSQWKEKSK